MRGVEQRVRHSPAAAPPVRKWRNAALRPEAPHTLAQIIELRQVFSGSSTSIRHTHVSGRAGRTQPKRPTAASASPPPSFDTSLGTQAANESASRRCSLAFTDATTTSVGTLARRRARHLRRCRVRAARDRGNLAAEPLEFPSPSSFGIACVSQHSRTQPASSSCDCGMGRTGNYMSMPMHAGELEHLHHLCHGRAVAEGSAPGT